MSKIKNAIHPELSRLAGKLTRNWKPKLITLAMAIVVWALVSYSTDENSDEWDEDDTRIVIPE